MQGGGTTPLEDPGAFWNRLHEQPRFRPIYPDENVVRFLKQTFGLKAERMDIFPKILDLGVGGGRHIRLLCEMGFHAYGLDISKNGLRFTQKLITEKKWQAKLACASMSALPYKEETFDGIISFGVVFYGGKEDMLGAIQEIHRTLKMDGRAFIVLRTRDDYRYGKGDRIAPDTFLIRIKETNEYGTVQHFVSEEAVFEYFSRFSYISLEKTETTFMERKEVNSDWLISLQK